MDRWSKADIGETLGPLRFEMTPEFHGRFIEGNANDRPEHDELVDPTVAGNLAIYVLASRYPGPIIHTHQELRFLAPVWVGDTVSATGTLTRKQMRRDKAYVAIDCDFTRDGEPVWWARMTCIWPEVHLRGEA